MDLNLVGDTTIYIFFLSIPDFISFRFHLSPNRGPFWVLHEIIKEETNRGKTIHGTLNPTMINEIEINNAQREP